jgi:hypothetical protein
MRERWRSWGTKPFRFALFACVQFVVLTAVAMWAYPGGSAADPSSRGYSFFHNFFSELGLTVTRGGHANWLSFGLFVVALTVAGLGLVVYFLSAPQFFWRSGLLRLLSILGSLFGVASGLSFIGVAFAPANLQPVWHGRFTLWAFELFLVAAVFYAITTLLKPTYPRLFALVYVAFAALLAGYVGLMMTGPRLDTPHGVMIQAAGQKAIVYAAIVCTFIQSWGAVRLHERGLGA